MDMLLFVIVALLIICFAMSFHQTDDIIQLKSNNISNSSTVKRNNKPSSQHVNNIQSKPKCNDTKDIYLYDEDIVNIRNKGFLNELIYKPSANTTQLSEIYINDKILSPEIPLNDDSYTKSQDLPIGNINIQYLLNKNTSKLSM